MMIACDFVSHWSEGVVESPAKVDLETGQVEVTEVVDVGEELEHLVAQSIEVKGQSFEIDPNRWEEDGSLIVAEEDLEVLRQVVVAP